jgi:hypothetical protein
MARGGNVIGGHSRERPARDALNTRTGRFATFLTGTSNAMIFKTRILG